MCASSSETKDKASVLTTGEINALGDSLYAALRERQTVPPPRMAHAGMTLDDAYAVSGRILDRRLADGARVVGRKIGLTSVAVQQQLGVDQPDFGNLTDDMQYPNGAVMPISTTLIQPKAEGEIAFVLRDRLAGPDVTPDDVIAATHYVSPCFEIVDSRVADWKIQLIDTVADNASCGLFLLGDDRADPAGLDLASCVLEFDIDGRTTARGTGAAALGSPLIAVAWLANRLSSYGVSLEPGDIVLSGSLVPFQPAVPGASLAIRISGIGTAEVSFA